jgi:hypothetical protein
MSIRQHAELRFYPDFLPAKRGVFVGEELR